MDKVESVAIIGLGLIGGSMASTWKRTLPHLKIVGFDSSEVMESARTAGVIDTGAASAADAASTADVVIIATPLSSVPRTLSEIGEAVRPGSIITDTGSVKRAIADLADEYVGADAYYIGGHPMTGSEKSGFDAADDFLFENATYVLCPNDRSQHLVGGQTPFVELIRTLGSRILVMDPEEHDRVAAAVSHLPQLLSVSLVNAAGLDQNEYARHLAAGGFRDMTRIASSPFPMWKDILAANHGPILDRLATYASRIQQIRNRLIEEDYEALGELFRDAEASRALISADSKGFLRPLADLFVRVEDKPGELKRITGILSDNDVNIKDLELLKLREGTGGTFRISFDDDRLARRAAELLESAGYTTRKPA